MVSQCLENQGYIIIRKDKKKYNIWYVYEKLNAFFLNNFKNIIEIGKINDTIPVGLTKKIKPNDIPEKIAFIFPFFSSIYHLDKNNKLSIQKDVNDKSIK